MFARSMGERGAFLSPRRFRFLRAKGTEKPHFWLRQKWGTPPFSERECPNLGHGLSRNHADRRPGQKSAHVLHGFSVRPTIILSRHVA